MIKNNRIIVDLNKAQYGFFCYTNQYGQRAYSKHHMDSVRGEQIPVGELALFHPNYPKETVLERAKRLNIVDVWTPTFYLKLQASCCLVYTGEKAITIREAWNAKVFSSTKKKGKNENSRRVG